MTRAPATERGGNTLHRPPGAGAARPPRGVGDRHRTGHPGRPPSEVPKAPGGPARCPDRMGGRLAAARGGGRIAPAAHRQPFGLCTPRIQYAIIHIPSGGVFMKRTTIMADEALLLEVRDLAAREGKTLTAVFEEALRAYVGARRPRHRVSFLGVGDSGQCEIDLDAILAAEINPEAGWSPRRRETDRREGETGGRPGRYERPVRHGRQGQR